MRDKYVPGRRGSVDKVILQGAGSQGDLAEEATCVASDVRGRAPEITMMRWLGSKDKG